MFLKTILIPSIFAIITFIVVLPKPRLPSGFSNILCATVLTRKKINQAFIVTIKLKLNLNVSLVTVLEKESVSHTLTHTSHHFLPQTLDATVLSSV